METKINNQVQELNIEMNTSEFLKKLGFGHIKGKIEDLAASTKWREDNIVEIKIKVKEVDRLKQIDYTKVK